MRRFGMRRHLLQQLHLLQRCCSRLLLLYNIYIYIYMCMYVYIYILYSVPYIYIYIHIYTLWCTPYIYIHTHIYIYSIGYQVLLSCSSWQHG
jgi:hypothetical protein